MDNEKLTKDEINEIIKELSTSIQRLQEIETALQRHNITQKEINDLRNALLKEKSKYENCIK